ncbi:hypothetical protein JCM10296v2_000985 [Rhodotorula toruloides]
MASGSQGSRYLMLGTAYKRVKRRKLVDGETHSDNEAMEDSDGEEFGDVGRPAKSRIRPPPAAPAPLTYNKPALQFTTDKHNAAILRVVAISSPTPCEAAERFKVDLFATDEHGYEADRLDAEQLAEELRDALDARSEELSAESKRMNPRLMREFLVSFFDEYAQGGYELSSKYMPRIPLVKPTETGLAGFANMHIASLRTAAGPKALHLNHFKLNLPTVTRADVVSAYSGHEPFGFSSHMASADQTLLSLSYLVAEACHAAGLIETPNQRFSAWCDRFNDFFVPYMKEEARPGAVLGPHVTVTIYHDRRPQKSKQLDLFFRWARETKQKIELGELSWDEAVRLVKDDNAQASWRQGPVEVAFDNVFEGFPDWSPLHTIAYDRLVTATSTRHLGRDHRPGGRAANSEERVAIFRELAKEIKSEVRDGVKYYFVDCVFSGEHLVRIRQPKKPAQFDQAVIENAKKLSLDHYRQIAICDDGDGIKVLMNSPANLGFTFFAMNTLKHRYQEFQFALITISIRDDADPVENFHGRVKGNEHVLKGVERISTFARDSFATSCVPCPSVPCPVIDRLDLPLARICYTVCADKDLMEEAGIKFFKKFPHLPDFSSKTPIELMQLAENQLQALSDAVATKFPGEQLRLDDFLPVRPGTSSTPSVTASLRADFRKVSEQLDQARALSIAKTVSDFLEYGIRLRKTSDGVLALTMSAKEPAKFTEVVDDDIIEVCVRSSRKKKHNVEKGVTVYANGLCYVAFDILCYAMPEPKAEAPQNYVFYDPAAPRILLLIPIISKHAFLPSICQNVEAGHKHQHGFPDEELDSLRFDMWNSTKNTWRYATWASNCLDGFGRVEQNMVENRAHIRRAINGEGTATGVQGGEWILKDFSPTGEARVSSLLKKIKEIKARIPQAPPGKVLASPEQQTSADRKRAKIFIAHLNRTLEHQQSDDDSSTDGFNSDYDGEGSHTASIPARNAGQATTEHGGRGEIPVQGVAKAKKPPPKKRTREGKKEFLAARREV